MAILGNQNGREPVVRLGGLYLLLRWVIMLSMVVAYVVCIYCFAVLPIVERSREEVLREAEAHALYISGVLAHVNRQALLEGSVIPIDVSLAANEKNVAEALLVDSEGKILNGPERGRMAQNEYLSKYLQYAKSQGELVKAKVVRQENYQGIAAYSPILIKDPKTSLGRLAGVTLVVISTSYIKLDQGTYLVILLETLFWVVLGGACLVALPYWVFFRRGNGLAQSP